MASRYEVVKANSSGPVTASITQESRGLTATAVGLSAAAPTAWHVTFANRHYWCSPKTMMKLEFDLGVRARNWPPYPTVYIGAKGGLI